MISYVKGILAEKAKDRIVVESGMMGIGIFVPMSVLEVLPPLGEEVKIYTHLQVREDDMSLYGFLSRSDLEMFRQLLGVNGIGPKGALGILSALRPEDLRLAVMTAPLVRLTFGILNCLLGTVILCKKLSMSEFNFSSNLL